MKRTPIIIGAFCALTAVIISACGGASSGASKASASLKEAASPKHEDTFVLGDANGDGTVTIDDATLIQRVLCESVEDTDGKIAQRGDVDGNGLSIMDVTIIMRYLAEYDDEYGVGTQVPQDTAAPTTEAPPVIVTEPQPITEQITDAPETEPPATQPATSAPQPATSADPQPTTVPEETMDITLGENDLPLDYV